jgi:hypothetical protein
MDCWSRFKRFSQDPKTWLEFVALTAVIFYTHYSAQQVDETRRSNRIAEQSLQESQRAYLAAGEVDQVPSGIKIHVTNFGHLAAEIVGGHVDWTRFSYPQLGMIEHAEVQIPPGAKVMPGAASEFAVFVDTPKLAAGDQKSVERGMQGLAINGTIQFKTGFDSTDSLAIHVAYDPDGRRWEHINEGVRVNLRGAK